MPSTTFPSRIHYPPYMPPMVALARCVRRPIGLGLAVWLLGVLGMGQWAYGADAVTYLPDHAESLERRFDMVLAAKDRIDLAYFIVDDDVVGRSFLDLLADAARRGVRVRMVVDGLGDRMDQQAEARLLAAGVRIKKYHPAEIPFLRAILRRLHDKLLLCDGAEMIVGSRNIDDAHFGLNDAALDNYLELDVHVRGSAVAQAGCYFEHLWISPELREVRAASSALVATDLLGACADDPAVRVLAPPPTAGACSGGQVEIELEADATCFLCDTCCRKDCPNGIRAGLYDILDSARHSIVLETPYFVPSDELGCVLRDALSRGVKVFILTNSWQTTDYPVIYAGYRNAIGRYRDLGAQVWEYRGPERLHAKSFVVDGRIACVTSFNFDPRSAYLDTQTALVVDSPAAAAGLLDILEGHFSRATPIGPCGPFSENPFSAEVPSPLGLPILRLVAPMIWRQL